METIEEISDLICLMHEEEYISESQRARYEQTLENILNILKLMATIVK